MSEADARGHPPRVIAHVGLGKTGSTHLQRVVFKRFAAETGWSYLRARDIQERLRPAPGS
ncbi:hypothetical protein [Pseudoruegeria aquimaris]|uniref:hypothetical protein n=1 Tax=Pseudoruegeria aquimaris TaxID=393663 RepID=UPI00111C0048|nr:hypothetical protein [Pseudoruegeria aquimaris]